MRRPARGPWPAGLLGLIVAVTAVEVYVARHDRDYTTLWAQCWKWSRQAAGREAARSEILCFGDSLVLHGVVPNVIEGRLNRKAYNLAVFKGQAPANYFLLGRALAAGARPAAVLVDGELLEDDPTEQVRLWPELAGPAELGGLALAAGSPGFFGATAVSGLLPTYKARWEIRAAVAAALAGSLPPDRTPVRPRRRNAERNRGAQVLPVVVDTVGRDQRQAQIANYRPGPWKGHPVNLAYVEKFLGLAASRGVPVYWLLLPYYPGVQAGRERGGWDAAYAGYVAGLQARFPNLVVIDGRHAGYPREVLYDMTHLNRVGALAFSEAVAGALGPRLGRPVPAASADRWVTIPPYREPADPLAVEDVIASTEALRQQHAGRGAAVRR